MEQMSMEREKLQMYTARITQANRSELVVITYDLILESIECAKQAFQEANHVVYETELKRVQKLFNELMGSLDYQYPISKDLMQLYTYSNRRVVEAFFQKEPKLLDSVTSVIEKLRVGFEKVAKEDQSAAVMQNTQKLYAGLTYGRNSLEEVSINVDEATRGFKA